MPAAKVRKRHPEADVQRVIVAWLRAVLPSGSIVHCSANEVRGGGERARLQQAVNVGMGVYPGFSDLQILTAGRVLFVEVKSKTGRQSPDQRAFQDEVTRQGHPYAVVRSVPEVEAFLDRENVRTRAVRRSGTALGDFRRSPVGEVVSGAPAPKIGG